MQIIKNDQLIDNTWSYAEEDCCLTIDGDITVSLNCWNNYQDQLLNRVGKIGIRLLPDDDIKILIPTLNFIELIELNFPVFTDGRLFSHARLLRRHGYTGEIRAIGEFIPDQVFYLKQVGVTAFAFEKHENIPLALNCMNDFTVSYQNAISY